MHRREENPMNVSDLIEFWSRRARSTPYVHPDDASVLAKLGTVNRSPSLQDAFLTRSRVLRLNLLPRPFIGDLRELKDKIIVLALNPGYRPLDDYLELNMPEYVGRIEATVDQRLDDCTYPFMYFDPALAATAGFNYWFGVFDHIFRIYAAKHCVAASKAVAELSRRTICLELIPYHSRTLPRAGFLARNLASAQHMRAFFQDTIIPAADRGEVLAICVRAAKHWGVTDDSKSRVVVQKQRKVSLPLKHKSRDEPSGLTVLRYLGIEPDDLPREWLKNPPDYPSEA